MSWDTHGRIAVVTGASSGIGEATARLLAAEGMTVVAVARRADRLAALAEERDGIEPFAADVTVQEDVDALLAHVVATHGACHALINNAGIGGGPLRGPDDLADTLRTIEVNLLGTVRTTATFADLLAASAPARVINVASVAGKLGIGPAGYAASKFGVVGFSEALAFSWADRDVTVCQLNPGFIATEGFPQTEIRSSPLGRIVGEPADVADAILDALQRGLTERTVPRGYRGAVVLRHTAAPIYRAIASRLDRSGGDRGGNV